ncbi:MAG: hypothetical protein R2773_04260 [Flavobacteriaceae bacterium]
MRPLFSVLMLFGVLAGRAQYTQVPDPNFEQALIDLGIDSEGILDGQFPTADGIGVEYLYLDNRNINDITGIEAFVDLLWLDLYGNNLVTVDLSGVAQSVYTLNIGNNHLQQVDLSPLPGLINIGLHKNDLTFIDASNFTSGFVLSASDNPLISVNLNNSAFQILEFQDSSIENIDLSTLTF